MNHFRNLVLTVSFVVYLFTLSAASAIADTSVFLYGTDPYISVTYDTPHCGTPMTFTLTVENGSSAADYKYRFYSITDGEWQLVDIGISKLDGISSTKPVSSNQLSFTFYASGSYTVRFQATDPNNPGLYIRSDPIDFMINDPNYPSVADTVSDIAAECIAACTSEFDRALWLHDHLLDHADYDSSLTYCNAEGVLLRGTGTCESYSRAYCKLLDAVGISNVKLTGKDHTWNIVRIDGKWYQIDPTWDDPSSNAPEWKYHLYFALTDDLMQAAHSYHTPQSGYECDSYESNYYIRTGKISNWIDPLKSEILRNLDVGITDFTIQIQSSNVPAGFWYSEERSCRIMYTLAAYAIDRMEWKTSDGSTVQLDAQYVEGRQLRFTAPASGLILPSDLTSICDEAFSGSDIRNVVVPSGCLSIGSRAFSSCGSLISIHIPASVSQIADDAFYNSPNVTIITPEGSTAQTYASDHSISCITG